MTTPYTAALRAHDLALQARVRELETGRNIAYGDLIEHLHTVEVKLRKEENRAERKHALLLEIIREFQNRDETTNLHELNKRLVAVIQKAKDECGLTDAAPATQGAPDGNERLQARVKDLAKSELTQEQMISMSYELPSLAEVRALLWGRDNQEHVSSAADRIDAALAARHAAGPTPAAAPRSEEEEGMTTNMATGLTPQTDEVEQECAKFPRALESYEHAMVLCRRLENERDEAREQLATAPTNAIALAVLYAITQALAEALCGFTNDEKPFDEAEKAIKAFFKWKDDNLVNACARLRAARKKKA